MSDQNQEQGYEAGYAGHVDSDYLDNAVQGEILQLKHQTYTMMRAGEGHTVLDVGCGPASDTIALGKIVGPTGMVIGIDHDSEMVTTANQRAIDVGVADYVEHRLANGLELPFEDNMFDSCRSERVFQHVPEADQLLAEMIRVTKPGGYIVVADADHSTHSTSTQFGDMDMRIRDLLLQLFKNPRIGRELYTMMKRAGLSDVELFPGLMPFTDFDQWRGVLLDIVRPSGLQLSAWTEEEFDQYENDLQKLHDQGAFYAHAGYVLAGGRKPE